MITSESGKKCLETLNKIPKIKVIIGPYYDAGESIVIYNNTMNIEPLLDKIKTIRMKMNTINNIKSENYSNLQNKIHIL